MFVVSCKQDEEVIIERFGRYHKTVSQPGLQLKSPFDRVATRVTKQSFQKPVGVQAKTADGVFVTMDVSSIMRIVDAKQFHYSATDPVTQIGMYINAAVKQEASGMTLAEVADPALAAAAIDRAVSPLQTKLRGDYGIELVSVMQQALHVPEQLKHTLGNYASLQREIAEKTAAQAQDAKATVTAMQQGLQSDVRVKKPLMLKKPAS